MNTRRAPAMPSPLIDRMLRAQAYPHPVAQVTLVETHISWVLLTGSYAYKVKKPVNPGFLDYSTLALRRSACDEELRLNRRLAPQLYVDVVPIAGPVDRARVLGEGEAIEYAVRMHEFDQADQLDRLLEADRLEDIDIVRAAEHIAQIHEQSPRADAAGIHGTPRAIRHPVDQTVAKLRELLSDDAQLARLDDLAAWSDAAFDALAATFSARRRDGFVRECHGDLHLGNLVRLDHEVVAFDCIEFSEELRFIDVVSDIAFLMMDLLYRGRPRLAYALINTYLETGGDYDGVATLRYFLVYRALVRAMVALLGHKQMEPAGRAAHAAEHDADAHLRLAHALATPQKPVLLLMHGYSGSGKTHLSSELMRRWPALRVRSDVERKRLYGLAANDSTRSTVGAEAYSHAATHATYERLRAVAATALQAGFSIIVDAANLARWQRDRLRTVAASLGARFVIVSCAAAEPVLRKRLRARAVHGGDASEADERVLDMQLQHAEALAGDDRADAVTVDAELAADMDALVSRLRAHLDSA